MALVVPSPIYDIHIVIGVIFIHNSTQKIREDYCYTHIVSIIRFYLCVCGEGGARASCRV